MRPGVLPAGFFSDPKKTSELEGIPVSLSKVVAYLRVKGMICFWALKSILTCEIGTTLRGIFTHFPKPNEVEDIKGKLDRGEMVRFA